MDCAMILSIGSCSGKLNLNKNKTAPADSIGNRLERFFIFASYLFRMLNMYWALVTAKIATTTNMPNSWDAPVTIE